MSMVLELLRATPAELEAYIQDSSLLEDRIYEAEEEDPAMVNLDKSWEGILFLLTGKGLQHNDHPMQKVFFSGQNIDDDMDIGYGPAEYLTPEQVKETYAELCAITEEELTARFDPARMLELHIYPEIWEEEGIVYYLLAFFNELRTFYAKAAENNEAVITAIT
ncbi:YfbM family protein [Chitinophaga pinensis]|uniref:DUF1877 family protein n=1 Tax=Chitinophaga pinensis (strain ATCC 43595 / DSM 2588 / LMG 13176 / NBRC 15968 / NCIMB 11800 / UQM 2034) TaxID=485918 RepID=A0A979GTZ4_CHIPD|nr:YfbM family protein [Chitinophaga pinensis]ACU60454.1 Domain of unknown function DUF1877 [Chitinophaga pinensis DSM 2588]